MNPLRPKQVSPAGQSLVWLQSWSDLPPSPLPHAASHVKPVMEAQQTWPPVQSEVVMHASVNVPVGQVVAQVVDVAAPMPPETQQTSGAVQLHWIPASNGFVVAPPLLPLLVVVPDEVPFEPLEPEEVPLDP
jgi:hypothetical protein